MFPNQDPNQPGQPYYPPQQTQQPANPYEFITNSGQAPKKPLLPTGNSMAQRVLIVVGGLFTFVLVVVIFVNLVFGSGGGNAEKLISIAQQQTELVRVAGIGVQNAQDQDTKNFATTAQYSIASAQQQTLDFLAQHGTKVKSKELALGHNAQTDTQINDAVAASNFDPTFKSIMQTDLQKYSQSLSQEYDSSKITTERQLLKNDYDDAQLLLQQLKDSN